MEDDIKTLKEQEQQRLNGTAALSEPVVVPARPNNNRDKRGHRPRRRHQPSLFGPLLIIGAGIYFLLRNMGYGLELQLNWWALWQAWPVFLILIGLKIISEQAESGLLRGLVNLARLAGFALLAGLLFFGHQIPWVSNFLPQAQVADVQVPLDGRESAEVTIEFNSAPAQLTALDDSPDLLAGNVSYFGNLELTRDGPITLQTASNGLTSGGSLAEWQLGLSTVPALDLDLDLSSGAADLDLRGLTLQNLEIDGSSGATTLQLPDGNYEAEYEVGSGATVIHLPMAGQQTLWLNGGSGGIALYLAPEMAAQIHLEQGSGRFNTSDAEWLELDSGSRTGDGVWQTADYDADNPNRIIIYLETGSGSVRVVPVSGR